MNGDADASDSAFARGGISGAGLVMAASEGTAPTAATGDMPTTGTATAAGGPAPSKLLDTAAANAADKRSKKQQGKKRGRGGAAAPVEQIGLTAAQADHLRVVRVSPTPSTARLPLLCQGCACVAAHGCSEWHTGSLPVSDTHPTAVSRSVASMATTLSRPALRSSLRRAAQVEGTYPNPNPKPAAPLRWRGARTPQLKSGRRQRCCCRGSDGRRRYPFPPQSIERARCME
jgi:hypothetical protein